MATINLGRVGFVNKGAHNIATAYKVNDVVTYNSGTYACIQAHTGQLPTVTAYWQNWVENDKALDSSVVHKTGNETIAGVKTFSNNLNFANGTRITGDFSNATDSSRVAFESNVLNSYTVVSSFPNGTGPLSSFRAFNTQSGLNSSFTEVYCDQAQSMVCAGRSGTGSYLPMTFNTNGAERMRIDTAGNVLVTGSGALGYGTGSSGTVTQLTSKSATVALNKPSGRIIMNNEAMPAGAIVSFQFLNSLITTSDMVIVTLNNKTDSYNVWSGTLSNGSCFIDLKNISGGSVSEAIVITFAIIKGANS